jgi:hypothetical protein
MFWSYLKQFDPPDKLPIPEGKRLWIKSDWELEMPGETLSWHFPSAATKTDLGLVFPPEEKFLALRQFILTFLAKTSVTARQFSQLLGLLNSLADVVQLGRLYIRPLQFYLLEHWTARELRRPSSCENWRAVNGVLARKVRINWRRAKNFSSGGNTRPKSVLKCSHRKTKSWDGMSS